MHISKASSLRHHNADMYDIPVSSRQHTYHSRDSATLSDSTVPCCTRRYAEASLEVLIIHQAGLWWGTCELSLGIAARRARLGTGFSYARCYLVGLHHSMNVIKLAYFQNVSSRHNMKRQSRDHCPCIVSTHCRQGMVIASMILHIPGNHCSATETLRARPKTLQ